MVICQMIGKLKIPSSPNSKVKNPKKLIFIEDRIKTVKGRIKEINIKTLLALFKSSFCSSKLINRNMELVLMD